MSPGAAACRLQAQHRSDAWEAARQTRAEAVRQDMGIVAQQLQQAQQQLAAAAAQLHAWMDHAEAAGARLAADVAAQEAEQAQQAASAAAGESAEGGNDGSWGGTMTATPLTAAAQEAAQHAQQAKAAAEAAEQAAGAAEQALQDAQYQLGAARSSVQQRQQALSAYQALAAEPQAATAVGVAVGRNGDGRSHGHAHSSGSNGGGAGAEAVCDRCLQPIDLGLYWQNVDRMQASRKSVKFAHLDGLAVQRAWLAVRSPWQRCCARCAHVAAAHSWSAGGALSGSYAVRMKEMLQGARALPVASPALYAALPSPLLLQSELDEAQQAEQAAMDHLTTLSQAAAQVLLPAGCAPCHACCVSSGAYHAVARGVLCYAMLMHALSRVPLKPRGGARCSCCNSGWPTCLPSAAVSASREQHTDESKQQKQGWNASKLAAARCAAVQAHAEAERLASEAESAASASHAAEKQAQVAALQDMQRQLWAQQAAERWVGGAGHPRAFVAGTGCPCVWCLQHYPRLHTLCPASCHSVCALLHVIRVVPCLMSFGLCHACSLSAPHPTLHLPHPVQAAPAGEAGAFQPAVQAGGCCQAGAACTAGAARRGARVSAAGGRRQQQRNGRGAA